MKSMTTGRAKKESVTDQPVGTKKHTLYAGTLGHLRWLMDRKNKTITTGSVEMQPVLEICFAYTTDPEKLQTFKGAKATAAIDKFAVNLTNEDFARIQTHAEEQLMKYAKTLTSPKKKPEVSTQRARKATRARRR